MGNGIPLGSIGGIRIVADWSLLIIFLLIAFSLAVGVFPTWHPDWSPVLSWLTALGAAALFLASVLVHELSHAFVGRAVGVSIRRITLFIFGGMAHMEGEPRSWKGEFVMAVVGPLTSLVLGVVFLWLAGLTAGPVEMDPENPQAMLSQLNPLATLLLWLGPINMLLAAFNMVPGFPLDGGRALRAVLWGATGNLEKATRWASRGGQMFAWLLIGTGFAMIFGLRVPVLGGGLVGGVWLAFIGWFLNNAALMSYRQLLVKDALENVPVSRLMQTRFTRLAPDTPVGRVVEEHLMASGQRVFPLERDGRFLGIVSLRDLQKAPREAWDRTAVEELATRAGNLATVAPDADASEALNLISQRDVNQLAVVEGDRLVGLLRREDILKWLALYQGEAFGGGATRATSLERADAR
ncbi:MAG TPA: site-2 protease family protein [Pelomicrobium sp.]|nr:site-2 protease family protein [Pelomicrobium sp.]